MSHSLQPNGLQPTRFLCPWDSPGKDAGVGLPCPPSGDLPNPGIRFMSLMSPVLSGRFLTTRATWEAQVDLGLAKMMDLGLESKLKEIKGQ